MIKADTPLKLGKKAQEGIMQYLKTARQAQTTIYNLREHFRNIDLAYQREQDLTEEQMRAKLANKYGDATKYQNVTVPMVMPQVESAVTYQASVFLTNTPIFGVVAPPDQMDAATQMETVIEDQAIRGGWVNEFMLTFRDAFKYNAYFVEVDWVQEVTASLETDIKFSTKEGRPMQEIWAGNKVKRLDPYNTLYDLRVPLNKMHQFGEYVGYTEIMSRMQLKGFIASLPGKIIDNIVEAFESGVGTTTLSSNSYTAPFYIPTVNPEINMNRNTAFGTGEFNWLAWAGITGADRDGIQYKNAYQVTTLYARILPNDFGLRVPSSSTPQIWKFIFVNDSVLILAERQTNAHNYLPILCGQGTVDGLSYQTKSLASNVIPLQQLGSAFWNSAIATSRRAIMDRVLYDPSRISEKHINSANPAAKIPVRPAAYGKNVGEAVYPFPFRSDNLGDLANLAGQIQLMADKLDRQNPAKRGEFVKGNKLKAEVDQVMANASGGDQMRAMQLEASLFTPLKEIIKLNILQYQGPASLFNREKDSLVPIDPVALRKATIAFKISDGLIPSDQIISDDVMRDGFQTLANMPALAQGYNLSPLFSYMMAVKGAKLKPFEKPAEQVAYEQAVAQWQQLVIQLLKENPQIQTNQFPPQPTPEQFGYNPQQQVQPEEEGELDGTESTSPPSGEAS